VLGVVQGFVRPVKKLLCRLDSRRFGIQQRYASADGNVQVVFFNITFRIADEQVEIFDGPAKTADDFGQHMRVGPGGHKGKLIAAKARCKGICLCINFFARPAEVRANNLKHLIADKVTVGVVKCFEVVDIKEGQGKGLPFFVPPGRRIFDKKIKAQAVGNMSQGVNEGEVLKVADVFLKKNFDPVKG